MIIFLSIAAFLFSFILVPIVGRLAISHGWVDVPYGDTLKVHRRPIPHFGGVAIFFVFFVLFSAFAYYVGYSVNVIGAIGLSTFLIFALGLWDDIRWKHITTIRPMAKFILLIGGASVATFLLRYVGISFDFIPYVPWIWLPLTFVYVLGVINAVNFEDGLDGLAGGMVAISLAGLAIISFARGADFLLAISLIGFGGVLGFLVHNFPPAKIFMGDGGAYFLGFILVILALSFSKPYDAWSAVGILFVVGLPIFDAVVTTTRRLAQGKSPFLGDRDHLYDKILKNTGSLKKTLVINYFVQLIFVAIGVALFIFA